MQILRIDRAMTQAVQEYGGKNISFLRVGVEIQYANIGIMYIEPGGEIGHHQANGDQLFLVVQGSGWVAGTDRQHVGIENCQAAFWNDQEWHDAGSDEGMTAVIIEASQIHHQLEDSSLPS